VADLPIETTTAYFAVNKLELTPYDWQIRALEPLERATGANSTRQNITVRCPNGVGKDWVIIPTAALWWLYYHPKGRVAITTQSILQLTKQTIPAIEAHLITLNKKMRTRWDDIVRSPHWSLTTPEGGSITCFVTSPGERAEGWHKRDDSPLLLIINEAKLIKEELFRGLDRWTPNAVMMVSSPGTRRGRFWESHTIRSSQWTTVKAGLVDCPHIPQERIDFVINSYGKESPYAQSTLYGEFMDSEEGELFPITEREVHACYESPPRHLQTGFRYGFFDFSSGGRAKNVFCLRDGNKYEIVDAWRETNEDAIVGRCIALMREHNLKAEFVAGDAAAKSILDKLANAGWCVRRQSFGFRDSSPIYRIYRSWSAWAWMEGCNKIKRREVILPTKCKDTVIEQLTKRKYYFLADGRQALEEKSLLQKEGEESPDEMDAVFGAMAVPDLAPFMSPVFDPKYEEQSEHRDILENIGANVGF